MEWPDTAAKVEVGSAFFFIYLVPACSSLQRIGSVLIYDTDYQITLVSRFCLVNLKVFMLRLGKNRKHLKQLRYLDLTFFSSNHKTLINCPSL